MTIKEMQSMTLRKSTITSKLQKQAYKRTNKGRHLPQKISLENRRSCLISGKFFGIARRAKPLNDAWLASERHLICHA
jgi:hypothetical protein